MASRPETLRIAAVLLAAGSSSRLGQPKQLVKINGDSLVRRAALQLLRLNPVSLTVVTGSGGAAVEEDVRDLQLNTVQNDNWEQGMGASIACGAQNIAEEVDGLLIALCDQWKVDEGDLIRLVEVWYTDISKIISASWNDNKSLVYGPPALFPRNYIRELTELWGSQGAKSLIGRNMGEVKFVAMENAAGDLDTPADLEQLLRQVGPNPNS
jgi:CTP:molybdopterin cytidylyltransferase MocA